MFRLYRWFLRKQKPTRALSFYMAIFGMFVWPQCIYDLWPYKAWESIFSNDNGVALSRHVQEPAHNGACRPDFVGFAIDELHKFNA